MKALGNVLLGALGMLVGLQVLRTFLTGLVWLIGESLSPYAMGVFALSIVALGFLAGLIRGRLGRRRTERVTAAFVTGLYLASLAVTDTPLRTGLAAAATMVWVWWFSAFLMGRRPLAASLVGGLSLDVAIHGMLNGLDLPVANPGLLAAGIGVAFVALARSEPAADGPTPGWGFVALAPWIFVELEVLANLGRIRQLAGLGTGPALLVEAVGLAVCLVAMEVPMPGLVRSGLGITAALFLINPTGWVWVLAVQVGMGAALAGCLKPGTLTFWPPVAAFTLVALFFLFYSQATWPYLHATAAGALGLVALVVHSGARLPGNPKLAAVPPVLAVVALLAGIAAPSVPVLGAPAPLGAIRLMTFNVHQGLDFQSLPAPDRIVRTIEAQNPDIVALQEVNRGWMISGASDLVSYIEKEMPAYHLVYGPEVGDLWGTVILSRLPIKQAGYRHYDRGLFYTMGFTWAEIGLPGCDALILNTHLSTGRELGGERTSQMDQLLAFWNNQPCTIIMGDANAEPNSKAIRDLKGAGFTDWLSIFTDPRDRTWPADRPVESIDYVATTGEFLAVGARSVPTLASDHRPVVVDLVMKDRNP